MNKSIVFAIGVSIILMLVRVMGFDTKGTLVSLGLFIIIFSILLITFLKKQYDSYLIIWLSFYFASPMIVLPGVGIGSLGLFNMVFIPLMILSVFNLKNKYFVVLIFFTLVSIVNISDVGLRQILSRIFEFASPLLFFYFAKKKVKDKDLVIKAATIIALVNLPIVLYEVLVKPEWGVFSDWRGFRIYGNLFWPNSYSVFLLPITLFLYAKIRQDFSYQKLFGIILLIAANAFTLSRAGLIGLAVGFLTFELFMGGIHFSSRKIIIGLLIISTLFLYTMSITTMQKELTPDTLVERTVIWDEIVPLIQDNLILGNGLGSYELYRSQIVYSLSPHNYYLGVVFEIGVVGLLVILSYIGLMYKDFFQMTRMKKGFRSGELGLAIMTSLLMISFVGGDPFSQVVALNSWIIMGCLR